MRVTCNLSLPSSSTPTIRCITSEMSQLPSNALINLVTTNAFLGTIEPKRANYESMTYNENNPSHFLEGKRQKLILIVCKNLVVYISTTKSSGTYNLQTNEDLRNQNCYKDFINVNKQNVMMMNLQYRMAFTSGSQLMWLQLTTML